LGELYEHGNGHGEVLDARAQKLAALDPDGHHVVMPSHEAHPDYFPQTSGSATGSCDSGFGAAARRSMFGKAIDVGDDVGDAVQDGYATIVHASKGPMFPDQEAMKKQVRDALIKPQYSVSDYYWEDGFFRWLATHQVFENSTLMVISVNALWLAIDTDNNTASTLLDATPLFFVADNLFCVYFFGEWLTRYMAFKHKRDGLKDAWFVFDSILVGLMVAETWLLTLFLLIKGGEGNPLGNASILRLLRLLRLSRLAKMLRSMPELLILIKGMGASMKSVFYTMLLLCTFMYVFAIAFTQLTAGTEMGEMYFSGIPKSMITLLLAGTFLDNLGPVLFDIAGDDSSELQGGHLIFGIAFLLFICLAALMVMNMLIGVLCEVVQSVADIEKEMLAVTFTHERIRRVVNELDKDNDGNISKAEFMEIMASKEAIQTLAEVDVDPVGLVDFADEIFNDDSDEADGTGEGEPKMRELQFEEFMDAVLNLRSSNQATVMHIIDFTKVMRKEFKRMEVNMERKLDKQTSGSQKQSNGIRRSMSTPPGGLTRARSTSSLCQSTSSMSPHATAIRGSFDNLPCPPYSPMSKAETSFSSESNTFPGPITPLAPLRRPNMPKSYMLDAPQMQVNQMPPKGVQQVEVFLTAGLEELRKIRQPSLPGSVRKSMMLEAWAAQMSSQLMEGLNELHQVQEFELPFF